jgi:hypothetical protein
MNLGGKSDANRLNVGFLVRVDTLRGGRLLHHRAGTCALAVCVRSSPRPLDDPRPVARLGDAEMPLKSDDPGFMMREGSGFLILEKEERLALLAKWRTPRGKKEMQAESEAYWKGRSNPVVSNRTIIERPTTPPTSEPRKPKVKNPVSDADLAAFKKMMGR